MRRCSKCGRLLPLSEFWLTDHGARYSAECKACAKAAARIWYAKNKERICAKERNNPQVRLQWKKWYEGHRAKFEVYVRRHDTRLLEAYVGEDFTLDELFLRDVGICGICRKAVERIDASVDHVVPLSKGGLHTRKNVQLAHRRCNSSKKASNPNCERRIHCASISRE